MFAADPDGASLVDQDQIDIWVAHWGQWLAALGDEPGRGRGVGDDRDGARTPGTRLQREVQANLDDAAPDLAKAMLHEVVETYPAGSATVKAMVAVTFSAAARGFARGRDADEMAPRPRRAAAVARPGPAGDRRRRGPADERPAAVRGRSGSPTSRRRRAQFDQRLRADGDVARADVERRRARRRRRPTGTTTATTTRSRSRGR